jgi:hypothetical protein
VLRVYPHANVTVCPLADGGEGTTDALIEGLGGRKVELSVTGPMGSRVKAYYGILADEKTVVMEMAQAAGITLVEEAQRNPGKATTYGVGEMIRDAVSRGCRKFIIGVGGSATNDGGIGMLRALGVKFLTKDGKEAGEGADALGKIHFVSLEHLMPELKECDFQIACDVTNPLCGEKGATYIYGKQKISVESFTSGGTPFSCYPAMMKQRGDRFFTEGINNTLLHVYISQPSEEREPGMNAWFSSEFNRLNTWYPQMDLFTSYLKRVNYMLQQGLNIADVAYFIGEDAPKMTGIVDPELPKGYQFDYINAEVIERDLFVGIR